MKNEFNSTKYEEFGVNTAKGCIKWLYQRGLK